MAYLTVEEFTAYVGSEIPANAQFLQWALDAAEQAINDHCARSFNPPVAGATTRVYVPGRDVVIIQDLADSVGLVIADNDVNVPLADVQLEPVVSWSGEVRPYHRIRRLGGRGWTHDFERATVAVTSDRWGWAAVPAQVKEATAILAKDLAHVQQNRFGVAGFGEFGVVRVRDNPHVTKLLSGLRHPETMGIA